SRDPHPGIVRDVRRALVVTKEEFHTCARQPHDTPFRLPGGARLTPLFEEEIPAQGLPGDCQLNPARTDADVVAGLELERLRRLTDPEGFIDGGARVVDL